MPSISEDIFGLDLETTGVNPRVDTPVQICLMHQAADGGRRILLNGLVRPGSAIAPEAMHVHGIADDMVANAPDYAIVAWTAHLLYTQMQPKYLVTFNGDSFDVPMLNHCLGREVFPGALPLDVCNIAYRFFPLQENHRLGTLFRDFLGLELTGAHDASVDVRGTLDLLQAMRVKIGMSLSQLAEEMATPKPYAIIPIGKYRGTLIDDMPVGWARFMRCNATDMRPDLKATVDYIMLRGSK